MIDKDIKMKEKHMRLERHIVWSTDMIDLNDPWQRKWYIQQVLKNRAVVLVLMKRSLNVSDKASPSLRSLSPLL